VVVVVTIYDTCCGREGSTADAQVSASTWICAS
jgi:hypothetical protein